MVLKMALISVGLAGALYRRLQHIASLHCLGAMAARPNLAKLFQAVLGHGLVGRCSGAVGGGFAATQNAWSDLVATAKQYP